MLPEKIQAYFSFTKKERIGVLTLVALIIIVFLAPHFLPSPKPVDNRQAFEQFSNEIARLKARQITDSFQYGSDHKKNKTDRSAYDHSYASPHEKYDATPKGKLFYFDPNTISAGQWKSLGLRDRTIQTIQHYLSKGGKFRAAEGLQKVYGLHPDEYERLSPYVRIVSADTLKFSKKDEPAFKKEAPGFFRQSSSKKNYPVASIDINAADTTAFIALPGIGNKLATRIINFREKLGGFFSVDQIGEIYGLSDTVFSKIKPFFQVNWTAIKKIDINTVDENTLKQHPYIRWKLAKSIIAYRAQHGLFKSPDDLKQVDMITPELFQKITPYLAVSSL